MLILIILLICSFLQLNLCNEFINNENSNIYFKINNNDIVCNAFNSVNLTEKKKFNTWNVSEIFLERHFDIF